VKNLQNAAINQQVNKMIGGEVVSQRIGDSDIQFKQIRNQNVDVIQESKFIYTFTLREKIPYDVTADMKINRKPFSDHFEFRFKTDFTENHKPLTFSFFNWANMVSSYWIILLLGVDLLFFIAIFCVPTGGTFIISLILAAICIGFSCYEVPAIVHQEKYNKEINDKIFKKIQERGDEFIKTVMDQKKCKRWDKPIPQEHTLTEKHKLVLCIIEAVEKFPVMRPVIGLNGVYMQQEFYEQCGATEYFIHPLYFPDRDFIKISVNLLGIQKFLIYGSMVVKIIVFVVYLILTILYFLNN